MLQFQLIIYVIVKITRRDTTIPVYEFAAKQPRKEHKLGVVRYVKRPHTTCSFRVMSVSTHKTAYHKVVLMRVWNHNLPMLSHIQH